MLKVTRPRLLLSVLTVAATGSAAAQNKSSPQTNNNSRLNDAVRENTADKREEAAYQLGVEVTRHMGVAVDGKPAYPTSESKTTSSEQTGPTPTPEPNSTPAPEATTPAPTSTSSEPTPETN